MKPIKIQFESDQSHQTEALESVVELLDGLFRVGDNDFTLGDDIQPNIPPYYQLDSGWLEENLASVRTNNALGETLGLQLDSGFMIEGVSADTWEYPIFTVEMETGTGKTYVYLRTIHRLYEKYGLRKFIIVVPSVAIYEGVVKNIGITREHFKGLYDDVIQRPIEYDGAKPMHLKNFAIGRGIEVMVITVDSFNKKSNTIFKRTDKLMGERYPYQYIQETRPILILDESQNYQSEKSKAALRTLKPLFAINYSATPGKDAPNLVYKLSPFDAFRRNLVKKIEVLGMIEAQSVGQAEDYLRLLGISKEGKQIVATFDAMVRGKDGLSAQEISVTGRANLATLTKNPAYEGWVVEEINEKDGFVQFKDRDRFSISEERLVSITKEAVFKRQIEETIRTHFEKQALLKPYGVKVLSLFFIDRVANYVGEEALIKRLFDEAFERLKHLSPGCKGRTAAQVREGYFAKKKATKTEAEAFVDDAPDENAEKAAYELIMKEKERLLSFEEPVAFIFAHSALREGWDNPNVFQICALREIVSVNQRRQTIGRGLRLPVNQEGKRLEDRSLNVLTVVANESYANYAQRLQEEYEATGDLLPAVPADASKKQTATRNKRIYDSRDFKNFWNKLIQKTEYEIKVENRTLVDDCIRKLNGTVFPEPSIVITRGRYVITNYRLELLGMTADEAHVRICKENSDGNRDESDHFVKVGHDFSKIKHDPVLKPFKVVSLSGQGDTASLGFSEGGDLTRDRAIIFSTEQGQSIRTRREYEEVTELPKFNLIERASRELSLTRSTVVAIFSGLQRAHKESFIKNPEGFAGLFISVVKDCLAEHIADRLEYTVTEEILSRSDADFFPEEKKYPVKELIAGREDSSLYDYVQVDSDNERQFVERVNEDGEVLLYFKFPPTFKIRIPRIIGNYNPDWGLLRWNAEHRLKLELVRETKGNLDLAMLQHSNEGRKVRCAQKHFAELGISYRHIKGDTVDWWKEEVREAANSLGV